MGISATYNLYNLNTVNMSTTNFILLLRNIILESSINFLKEIKLFTMLFRKSTLLLSSYVVFDPETAAIFVPTASVFLRYFQTNLVFQPYFID
jgi:hypothetical protein